jgi:hypothetical protein
VTYVAYEEKSAAQRAADREADERWMRNHQPVRELPEPAPWGAAALVGSPAASAH